MIDAITVQPDARPSFDPDNRMPETRGILRICSSLVVLVQRSVPVEEVRQKSPDEQVEVLELHLAHFSVKEYLVSRSASSVFGELLEEINARATIATICLTYLPSINHDLSIVHIRAKFGFAQYRATYWAEHAEAGQNAGGPVQDWIVEFFHIEHQKYLTCYSLFHPDFSKDLTRGSARLVRAASPLYFASLGGLIQPVRVLLAQGADVNASGGEHDSALQPAS